MSKSILFYTSEFQTKILNYMDEMFNPLVRETFHQQISEEYENYRDFVSSHPEPCNDWLQTLKNIYNGISKQFPSNSLPPLFTEPKFLTETYSQWIAYRMGAVYVPDLIPVIQKKKNDNIKKEEEEEEH